MGFPLERLIVRPGRIAAIGKVVMHEVFGEALVEPRPGAGVPAEADERAGVLPIQLLDKLGAAVGIQRGDEQWRPQHHTAGHEGRGGQRTPRPEERHEQHEADEGPPHAPQARTAPRGAPEAHRIQERDAPFQQEQLRPPPQWCARTPAQDRPAHPGCVTPRTERAERRHLL